MIDELYINGKKADLSDTGISLTYQSTIFSEISKLVSNFSYTIKLPKTDNNIKLIEGAIFPSSGSRFPYIVHSGTVLRDGVKIVDKANVVILSISDEIELSLTWGTSTALSQLIEDGATLKDLPITDTITIGSTSLGSEVIPIINWGSQADLYNVFDHPVIYVANIVEKIQEKYNVGVIFPSDLNTYINRMMIPLTSEEGFEVNIEHFTLESSVVKTSNYDYQTYRYRLKLEDTTENVYYRVSQDSGSSYINNIDEDIEFTFDIEITVSAKVEGGYDIHDYSCVMNVYGADTLSPTITYTDNNNAVLVYKGTVKGTPQTGSSFGIDSHLAVVGYKVESGTVKITPDIDYLKKGAIYSFVDNMPDIKITDFIKTIKTMFGLYAKVEDGNIILDKYDNIYDFTKAEDWSDRLVYGVTGDCEINFHTDLAQRNTFTYKNDEVTNPKNDGVILIDDMTLDDEDEAFTSEFEASEMTTYAGRRCAIIPIYTTNEDGEVDYNDVNPRILASAGQLPNSVVGTFDGLQWPTLISKYYQKYIDMMTDAKYVTVDMIITPVELKEVDLYKPIYLKQYGCYFAITEIKTGDNNICTVELIKL